MKSKEFEIVNDFFTSIKSGLYYLTDGNTELSSDNVKKIINSLNSENCHIDYNSCGLLRDYFKKFLFKKEVYELSKDSKNVRLALSHFWKIKFYLDLLCGDRLEGEFSFIFRFKNLKDEEIFIRMWKFINLFLLRVEKI